MSSKIDLDTLLVKTALKSNMQHKHACAITYHNKIISIGYNRYNLNFKNIYDYNNNCYQHNKYSIHAERDAIMKIKDKSILKYCKIYSIRINNELNIHQGIPCDMCNKLLNKYNLTKILCI
jgi:deoxycytidylate deaminase